MGHSKILSTVYGHAHFLPPNQLKVFVRTIWVSKQTSRRRCLLGLPLLVGGLILGLAGHAHAAPITYSGTFNTDDQLDVFNFTVSQASQVTFETDSYGGGMLGGSTVAAGGFVPILTLFSSTGAFLAVDGGDGTCQAGMSSDATTGMCDDAEITSTLSPGAYSLVLSEFFNYANGPNLSDGFSETGQGDFTGPICGTTGGFYETDVAPCAQRTDAYSVTETATPLVAAAPEPGSLMLSTLPIVALCFARWRKYVGRA
jgi:hypothetical protein